MKNRHAHSHPCQHCKTPVECHGEQEQNHDGFPSVICTAYHLPSGTIALVLCEDCAEKSAEQERADAVGNV